MDQLVDGPGRDELVARIRDEAQALREKVEVPDDAPPVTDASVRSAARTDVTVPDPPFWGVREIEVELDEVYHHLDTHVLFKLHWGGRGVKGEAWRRLITEDFQPRLERMWAEQDYLRPRALLGYFPCRAEGNEVVVLDPDDPGRILQRFVFPRQPRHDRICLSDFFRPADSGELDVVAFQAVTVGPEVTKLIGRLEAEGEFSEQLFVHGLAVQAAEGSAEWLHSVVRRDLGIPATRGRRYSWGYPACPEQSEHEKLFALLGCESIGLSLSGGHAVEPEQSTVAIVAHHPQAVYFGMKSGFLPKSDRQAADELIAGSDRDPTARAQGLPDSEPAGAAADAEPAMAAE
jgi:5-methyltetrahydrofolate--homocysteine methyltransferase